MNQSDILTGSVEKDNEERSGSVDSVRLGTEGLTGGTVLCP